MIARAFLTLSLLASTTAVAADPEWSMTTADLKTRAVKLEQLDSAAGVTVSPADGGAGETVPMERFVEVSRNTPAVKPAGTHDLHLVGGDVINGTPTATKGESVVWKHPLAGEVTVPLTRIAGISRAGQPFTPQRRNQDLIVLANGDQVPGTLLEVTPEQVLLQTDTGEVPVPFDSVASVVLAATVQPGGKGKPSFRIRLADGSSLSATSVKLDGEQVAWAIGSAQPRTLSLDHVAAIEQVNGPVAFLSNRPPSENLYVPYLGSSQRYVARMNLGFDGQPIRAGDRVYSRAIAAHSRSRITWPLDGEYTTFRTGYAMDDRAGQAGADVTVRVLLDGRVAFEQKNVRPRTPNEPIQLDLDSAKSITLEVDYGQLIDSNDHLNWLEPALLKEKPVK